MMFEHRIHTGARPSKIIGRYLSKVGQSLATLWLPSSEMTMTQTTRAISHRDGVPIYQYRTDPDTPPVSVHRHGHPGSGDPRDLGRHIHDFPALWYVPVAGLAYVAAAGEV